MPVYLYKAKKNSGQNIEGQVEALSRQEALAKIDSLELFPTEFKEQKSSLKKNARISQKALIEFTHQLSTLINSGSTLLSSLDSLIASAEYANLKQVMSGIALEVRQGADFSEALGRYPHVFSRMYVSLVKVGEASGTLSENLRSIAEFLEEELDFRTNMISIATYPFLIICVGLLTVFVLLKFVIPKIVNIFQEMGQALPLTTSMLVSVSDFFSSYWLLIAVFFAVCFFFFKSAVKKPSNKQKWDRFKLRLPLFGGLLKKVEFYRFSRMLSALLTNGVSLDASFKVLEPVLANDYFRKELNAVANKMRGGSSLNAAMNEAEIFNPAFINVVRVGEETGKLNIVLKDLSQSYKKDIDRSVKNLLSLLEPVLIFVVGFVVGFVVISMLLPVFQMDFNF